MIWATVSSRPCFCWLYTPSPFSAEKNIINLISVLTIWWCPFAFSFYSLGSRGKNTGMGHDFLLQWTMLSEPSTMTCPSWVALYGMASLSSASPFTMRRLWPMKEDMVQNGMQISSPIKVPLSFHPVFSLCIGSPWVSPGLCSVIIPPQRPSLRHPCHGTALALSSPSSLLYLCLPPLDTVFWICVCVSS